MHGATLPAIRLLNHETEGFVRLKVVKMQNTPRYFFHFLHQSDKEKQTAYHFCISFSNSITSQLLNWVTHFHVTLYKQRSSYCDTLYRPKFVR